ncbi:MAG TPA: zinc-dependent alcohol dehydrogenase family protein [Candidatus Manganitrophaceae bacterium]|nr:zinc-dependent alcohol dehydrogenase family protein [Candidatus Manganitrophaceae bacterium]
MKAMIVGKRAPVESKPLTRVERAIPEPRQGEVLIQVEVCALCRTDLHVIEGELPVHKTPLTPGHQVVGRISKLGPGAARFQAGDRVGVAWLHAACGVCRFCRRGEENLCESPRFTGYDVDGGYAEYIVAPEAFIYPIPAGIPSHQAAPLLCAGIIGYRSLLRSGVQKGEKLGLYGFGASAHVVIQIAQFWGCEVYVSTRGARHRELALALGATWVGEAADPPPVKLNGAILFAPAGELVPVALEALDRGGTLALAGIYMTDLPPLDYEKHLFYERSLRSVTANTREDGAALLKLAREIPIQTHTERFSLEDANEALRRLKQDGIQGAGLLEIG